MNIKLFQTTSYRRELKNILKQGKNYQEILKIINLLLTNLNQQTSPHKLLPSRYDLHKLKGNFNGCWECKIQPDWLLIFRLTEDSIILERTGSHSDLFKM